MKQLNNINKKLHGKTKPPERPVKDKDGNILTVAEKIINIWAEYFVELLNRQKTPENQQDIQAADTDLTINCEPPTRAER